MFRNRNIVIFSPGAAVLVALLAFSSFSATRVAKAAEEGGAPPKAETPAAGGSAGEAPLPEMSLGKADAPVTIIEYSSLSCPHCAAFHKEVLPVLKSEYIDTGKARYVVREFPLNDAALAGSVIARCLDPSRYFAFTDLLFSKQDEWAFKEDAFTPLKQLAKQAGMSEDQFNKCIDDEALQKKVLAVREQGAKEGVNATPSFFVNGKLLKGAPTLQAIVEAMKPYLSTQ